MIPTTTTKIQVERDEHLQKLLSRLQNEDRIFEYNVPPNIRQTYDDDALLEHLKRTYAQSSFTIEEPTEVKKYLKKGDYVIKKGLDEVVSSTIVPQMNGKVIGFQDDGRAEINFEGLKQTWYVQRDDLVVIGKYYPFVGLFDSYTTRYPAKEIPGGLCKNHRVTFTGKECKSYSYRVPDGTFGMMVDHWFKDSKAYLFIIWANQPGVVQNWNYDTIKWMTSPSRWFFYEAIKLHIPNKINLEKIKQEIYPMEPQ